MEFSKSELTDCVVLSQGSNATASVIWLHGLGADGHDFVPIVPELRLPGQLAIRFVFQHAPLRAVTINNGYVMRAWYDVKLSGLQGGSEDELGIRQSETLLRTYVQKEIDAGIPAARIVIAGFSQGGAIALHSALRYPQRLAGVMALSTYLPLRGVLATEAANANKDIPILLCHGTHDAVVPLTLGDTSRDVLQRLGYAVTWKQYPLAHEVSMPQVGDISTWLQERLPSRS